MHAFRTSGPTLPSLALLLLALCGSLAAAGAEPPAWRAKVDAWVLERATPTREAEFLVLLGEQADLAGAWELRGKTARGRYVFERLREVARRTQGPVVDELRAAGVEHRPFWIANMIWVKGDLGVVERMARRADVARVDANPWVRMGPPIGPEGDRFSPESVEPNITHTGAPAEFWDNGFFGQGAVVGGQDTGYDWDHGALKSQYRGWDGSSADHDYHWHDSIHSGGGSCGPDSPEPCDDNDHGTHTMGTMVGDDGGSNQIGMAPGATWIGCRNMNQGFGSPASYSECFEWFVAPTDLAGENPDPSKAPHVINNSWTCPGFEGCTDKNVLLGVVENARAAGIVVVASAGNSGSGCSTVSDPPAIYEPSFSVGATDNSDNIASFSSRGPVTVDGSDRLKPDISAPGVSVRSSVRNDGYAFLSGTSMAGPHVAGLVALVVSAAPCLAGDVEALEQYVIDTALPRTSTQTCGGVSGDEIPNNTYGWGAIRAALPEGLCSGGLSGALVGVSGLQARCRNLSTGDSVDLALDGATSFDCAGAGLAFSSGDDVALMASGSATGLASGPGVGGSAAGMAPEIALCRNATSGQTVTIDPVDGASWDCEAAGLTVSDGDLVLQGVKGLAD